MVRVKSQVDRKPEEEMRGDGIGTAATGKLGNCYDNIFLSTDV